MTPDERKAIELTQGGIELLRNAIVKDDPKRELELRARDLLSDVRAILEGRAYIVAQFPRSKRD